MQRREHHYLLRRIHALYRIESHVDAALERIVAKDEMALLALFKLLRLTLCGINFLVGLNIPLTDRHSVAIVVRAKEDEDSVNIVAVFGLQLVCLVYCIVPLTAADAIYIRREVEPQPPLSGPSR